MGTKLIIQNKKTEPKVAFTGFQRGSTESTGRHCGTIVKKWNEAGDEKGAGQPRCRKPHIQKRTCALGPPNEEKLGSRGGANQRCHHDVVTERKDKSAYGAKGRPLKRQGGRRSGQTTQVDGRPDGGQSSIGYVQMILGRCGAGN